MGTPTSSSFYRLVSLSQISPSLLINPANLAGLTPCHLPIRCCSISPDNISSSFSDHIFFFKTYFNLLPGVWRPHSAAHWPGEGKERPDGSHFVAGYEQVVQLQGRLRKMFTIGQRPTLTIFSLSFLFCCVVSMNHWFSLGHCLIYKIYCYVMLSKFLSSSCSPRRARPVTGLSLLSLPFFWSHCI